MAEKQAQAQAAAWDVFPRRIVTAGDKKHIFTHVEWQMRFYLLDCGGKPEPFIWVNACELRDIYAIPSAFLPPEAMAEALHKKL